MKVTRKEGSLNDVHGSIDPSKAGNRWKKLFAFFGPAYLVSVGYMDPGNWATDIAGGSQFGYRLIWVLLMSNFMALMLQSLSARLGIVQGKDLAQCNRDTYPPIVNFILYLLAEIAIAACDLAEVLGMAIGLNLLFHIPLLYGVLITLLDTFLLLYLQRLGMRKLEAFIIGLITIIGGCYLIEIFIAKPSLPAVAKGFIPYLPNHNALYIAIGIIGATVMPHNLYLHSALVQTRKVARDERSIKKALKFNSLDSAIALNIAFFVNAAILVLAGSVFFFSGHRQVASLQDAHQLLAPLLGTRMAPLLFAIALIAAGQSSTVTGTLAGQVVMEGYLHLRINPWVRRLITRLLAIVPTVLVILISGDQMVDQLLVFSQVLLSMQLAFAVLPLILFVSDKNQMGIYAIKLPAKIISWMVAAVILMLNMKLVFESMMVWFKATDNFFIQSLIVLLAFGLVVLLVVTFIYPLSLRRKEAKISIHKDFSIDNLQISVERHFKKIALALDYSEKDRKVIQFATQMANKDTMFVLIHVVESVSARMLGNQAQDYETRRDQEHLDEYLEFLGQHHYQAEGYLGFRNRAEEIARIVNETHCNLLIIGSHGHKVAKDLLFGETINSVRHMVDVPVFIAR